MVGTSSCVGGECFGAGESELLKKVTPIYHHSIKMAYLSPPLLIICTTRKWKV